MINKLIFCILGLVASKGYAATWDHCLIFYNKLLGENSILPKQHLSYVTHQSPTIADPRIKAIPILESEEDLIDLKKLDDVRLQMLPTPNLPFEQPFFNSGLPNASKMRMGLDLLVSTGEGDGDPF